MSDGLAASLITAGASLVVALGAGGLGLWNVSKASKSALDIQDFKSGIDRDLERLKAMLEHGQLISSTQWNAEFNAYQVLWKSIYPVRALATKLVSIDGELTEIGIVKGDFSEVEMEKRIFDLLQKYASALTECVTTINEHAPFYLADIRQSANEMHAFGNRIHKTHSAAFVARQKKQMTYSEQVRAAQLEYLQELLTYVKSVERVEELIRTRMASVQVLNLVTS
jgi:hypothetical protein